MNKLFTAALGAFSVTALNVSGPDGFKPEKFLQDQEIKTYSNFGEDTCQFIVNN
jgi:hypothetical protein